LIFSEFLVYAQRIRPARETPLFVCTHDLQGFLNSEEPGFLFVDLWKYIF